MSHARRCGCHAESGANALKQRCVIALMCLCPSLVPVTGEGQTFSQIQELGGGIGGRLTKSVAENAYGNALFEQTAGAATLVESTGGTTAFQFVTDRVWNRLLFSKKDQYIREFRTFGASPNHFVSPGAVNVSGAGLVFVADRGHQRVVVSQFDQASGTLSFLGTAGNSAFPIAGLSAVVWDGGGGPLTGNNFYTTSFNGKVAYWQWGIGGATQLWEYGSSGAGTGRFKSPSAICVSHSASSPDGSSVFGTDFYVVDTGNRRIVWLKREGASATWKGERSLPEGWLPVSCTVDHFGIVYVADKQNSQLVSYNWFLDEITRYGTYGTGATNYNTFAHPHDVHIPFGKKIVGGQTIWYGEGRILTAEDWGPGSGGLEHWLGVEIPVAWATGTAWGPQVDYRTTGMAYHTVTVYRGVHKPWETAYRLLWDQYLLSPAWLSAEWDGRAPDGSWAPVDIYHFHVTVVSAYGCQGQAWCQTTRITDAVGWDGPGSCECPDSLPCVPCEANVALPLSDDVRVPGPAVPGAFRLSQVLTPYQGPLLRREGLMGAPGSPVSGAVGDPVASVRAQGIRALAVDVPVGPGGTAVQVRVYSLTGRLVRVLVDEVVDPGSYVVGWDGEDAHGRAVQPGVYVAVMTAGSFRGVQRLLIK